MVTEKRIYKGIVTTLTVKLMPGKTVKDMWVDFFNGEENVPIGFFGEYETSYYFKDKEVHPELYSILLNSLGVSSYAVTSIVKLTSTRLDTYLMRREIYKITPFINIKRYEYCTIFSDINRWSLEARLDRGEEVTLNIETRSWDKEAEENEIKILNKENARKLRKYLVSLASVQGVPYSCTYKDDLATERSCEV